MASPTPTRTKRFLSTLSLRRATGIQSGAQQATAISIHALLAESDIIGKMVDAAQKLISIHALLAESDIIGKMVDAAQKLISIHALLAESDYS